jgi:hypothetical protein
MGILIDCWEKVSVYARAQQQAIIRFAFMKVQIYVEDYLLAVTKTNANPMILL